MAQVASNVRVGYEGDLCVAPVGTTLPVSAVEPLASGFVELGYVTSDGVTLSHDDQSTDLIAWQRGDIVRTLMTEQKLTLQASVMETNDKTVETYFGSYLEVTASGPVLAERAFQPTQVILALTVIDGDSVHRMVIPSAELTERGDLVYVTDDSVNYDMTFTIYPDASQVKVYHYWSAALPVATPPVAPPPPPIREALSAKPKELK